MAKRHRIRKRARAFAARGARSRKLASLRPGAMRKKGFRRVRSPAQNFRIRWFLAMGRALFCRRVGMGAGYYDRYLVRCGAFSVALAYEAQRVPQAAAQGRSILEMAW